MTAKRDGKDIIGRIIGVIGHTNGMGWKAFHALFEYKRLRRVEVTGFDTVRSIVAARAWSALAARFALTNSSRFRLRRTAHWGNDPRGDPVGHSP